MSVDTPTATEESELAERRCGRCGEMFPGDPELHPNAIPAWWVCAPCHGALFGEAAS